MSLQLLQAALMIASQKYAGGGVSNATTLQAKQAASLPGSACCSSSGVADRQAHTDC